VPIFQFKAPYQLSDISNDIQNKITVAVANLLRVNKGNVILSFASITIRVLKLQACVLVSVGLVNFQGFEPAFTSLITQDDINFHMAMQGLLSVELLGKAIGTSTSPGSIYLL
jgi:hypothetical protein